MDIQRIEKYLREDIKKSIQNDVFPLVASSSVPPQGGLFAAPRLIFAYIDYLGYLYKGQSSSENAVAFVRDYLGKVDKRYSEVGGLLYHIYRHGTIHEYEPKQIRLKFLRTRVLWFVYKNKAKELHLSGFLAEDKFDRSKETLHLRVHLNSLYDDLLSAIDFYIDDLKQNDTLRYNFDKARKEIEEPEEEDEVRKRGKKYIRGSDIAFIYKLMRQTDKALFPTQGNTL